MKPRASPRAVSGLTKAASSTEMVGGLRWTKLIHSTDSERQKWHRPYASVSFTQDVDGGTVYVDKVSGFAGEIATIYAVPDAGYRVSSVKVNGVEVARDLNGNYQFVLSGGTNVVEVTFVAI